MSRRGRSGTASSVVLFAALASGCGTFLELVGGDDDPPPPVPLPVDGGSDRNVGPGSESGVESGVELDGAVLPDGALAPDVGADQSAPPVCPGAEACERVVFVTKDPVPIGNVASADAYCTSLAASATATARVKNRTFVAWTSTAADPVNKVLSTRFIHGSKRYLATLPGNPTIASDWGGLISGNLQASIFGDEYGKSVGVPANVWTGTKADGSFLGPNCNDWSSGNGADRSTVGVIGSSTPTWSSFGTSFSCSATDLHLYCFEK